MTAPATSFHEEDALGKAYDGRLMRRLLVYVRPYRPLVAGALVLLFTEGALQLVGPALTRRVIDVALPARDGGVVRTAALLYALSLVAQFGCSYGETLLTSLLGQRVMRDLRLDIFAHLQRLPIAFFDRNPVGRLITRVTSDVEALNELFTAGVVSGLGDLFTLLAISAMMLLTDWRLAIASFLVIPLVYLASRVFQVRVREAYRDIRTRLARINAFLQERITGMRVVQLFGRERDEARRFDALNRAHLDAHLKSITIYALYFPVIEVLTSIALATLIVAASARVGAGTVSVGTVAAFLMLVRRFFQPLQDLSDKYNTLQQAMASSERIFRLLDTEAPNARPAAKSGSGVGGRGSLPVRAEQQPRPSTPNPHPRGQKAVTVEFHDVWFAYDTAHVAQGDGGARGQTEWVLKGVSFRARPGETVALVGHTGAGKTTVVSLLMRFYDPQRGRITISGDDAIERDIRDMPLDELRSLIGYVQQDIFLFAGDVATNIRLSNPIGDAEVAAAAAQVGADRVVRRLPGGYAHELGERGASISVGERQLLSFARAIAADPAILLLDEATSAVDSELEAEIQRALAVLMQGRTTIAVAHRLSTVVGADLILVMHHGQVVERGTHRELMARPAGLYERLYRLQVGEARAGLPGAAHADASAAAGGALASLGEGG
ncbi:MAG TPA: ABC transporter ATP-binding protein [Gemmatimonadaceae bacterium]|nr:ABC transporter ATP-binding protein [Gemmatimonadaceae bacterium]